MARKENDLVCDYRRTLQEAGIYEPKLEKAIMSAAYADTVIQRLMEELNQKPLTYFENNVKGSPVMKEVASLGSLIKMLTLHSNLLRTLGLNYDATPSKITESPNSTSKAAQGGGLAAALASRGQKTFDNPKQ